MREAVTIFLVVLMLLLTAAGCGRTAKTGQRAEVFNESLTGTSLLFQERFAKVE